MTQKFLPDLWSSAHGFLHRDRVRREAGEKARARALPICPDEVSERLRRIRDTLFHRLRLDKSPCPLDFEVHGEIVQEGYNIQRVSFASAPGIRVTGNLYVPEGRGPFPAVLNMHGHHDQGKIAHQVQARGHILARSGIVTLTVDAAGSGERSEVERVWSYHGAMKAAELFLAGDSLMGLQIRDNRTALDVLQSLPFVDPEKIGATGASGGGNQTMWLSAMDERVKAVVPVVSVGSFEAYVGQCNCMCETLPGGLSLAEEWEVLGLIAPRPLLVINALHDQPAFGHEAMTKTCRQVQEVYALTEARDRFDYRLFDMDHGYHREPLQAMLGWMQRWLTDAPASSGMLPDWNPVPEDLLLCYPPGERPDSCNFRLVRETLSIRKAPDSSRNAAEIRQHLARLIGWIPPAEAGRWLRKRALPDGTQVGSIESTRSIPLPIVLSGDWVSAGEVTQLILSPGGKRGAFVAAKWAHAATEGTFSVTADLPAVGELAWDTREVADTRFHDSSRACMWLGYTLIAEWAEAIASLCLTIHSKAPHSRIHVIAEKEMVFAALLCRALHPRVSFDLTEFDCPTSLKDPRNPSMAWCVPGFFLWGDIDLVRSLKALP